MIFVGLPVRGVALGRKKWIDVCSEQAALQGAAILSVIESRRRLKLPIRGYWEKLYDVLGRVNQGCGQFRYR